MREAVLTKALTTVFRPEAYERLKEISDEQRTSMGQVLRDLVDRTLFPVDEPQAVTADEARRRK